MVLNFKLSVTTQLRFLWFYRFNFIAKFLSSEEQERSTLFANTLQYPEKVPALLINLLFALKLVTKIQMIKLKCLSTWLSQIPLISYCL